MSHSDALRGALIYTHSHTARHTLATDANEDSEALKISDAMRCGYPISHPIYMDIGANVV